MKRSSASISLVLISSAVALVACERPYDSSSSSYSRSNSTTETRTRHRGGYYGTGALLGGRSSRLNSRRSGVSADHSAVSGATTRGGFGSSSRGFFGG